MCVGGGLYQGQEGQIPVRVGGWEAFGEAGGCHHRGRGGSGETLVGDFCESY